MKQMWWYFSRNGTEKTSRTTDQFACYQICTNCSHTKIITNRARLTSWPLGWRRNWMKINLESKQDLGESSTTDHINAINQLKEKCREYNMPLCVAFVDYEEAFDKPTRYWHHLKTRNRRFVRRNPEIRTAQWQHICTKRVRKSGSREE